MSGRVYLDWNASAPLRLEARAAMLSAMAAVGNPSSVHAEGRAARAVVERARGQVAALVGCEPSEIVFTSGATEAAALALMQRGDGRSIVSEVEHDCVHRHGHPAISIAVGKDGSVDLRDGFDTGMLGALDRVDRIAVQAANSETGVLNDLAGAADVVAERCESVLLFTDAVQAVGKVGWNFRASGADLAALSAHKLGGPRGVGCLVVRSGLHIDPVLRGGGQEMGRRSGTENVVGIAGFGAAAEAAARDLDSGVWTRVEKLRNILEDRLEASAPDTIFVGREAARLPNTSCFAVPGWKGETQVMQLDLAGFAISAGSACSSGKVRQSRVLKAMGYDDETAGSAIRVSIGPTTSEEEVTAFAETWSGLYQRRRHRAA